MSPSFVSGLSQRSPAPRGGLAAAAPYAVSGPSLASILSLDVGGGPLHALLADDDNADPRSGVEAAFQQVLDVLQVLQARVRESEALVGDLQDKTDSLEERRRLLARHADRAERDRDAARQRCEEADAEARRAHEDAMPCIERYMECEVLRSELQASGDELVRLREETATCREELERGWPRLAEAEDAAFECTTAIGQLEQAHAEEVAVLTANHLEELSSLQAEQADRMSELEDRGREELATLKANNEDELRSLRASLEAARWEADVFRREHADIIRETCLRQRENTRLAKRFGEARQDGLELAVKLEALRASEAGAPAREAELQALQHRKAMLERTSAEWGDALQRKRVDCEAWRRWAIQRGAVPAGEDLEADDVFDAVGHEVTAGSGSLSASLDAGLADSVAMGFAAVERSGVGSSLSLAGRSLTPTPGRVSGGTPRGKNSGSAGSIPAARSSAQSRARGGSRWAPPIYSPAEQPPLQYEPPPRIMVRDVDLLDDEQPPWSGADLPEGPPDRRSMRAPQHRGPRGHGHEASTSTAPTPARSRRTVAEEDPGSQDRARATSPVLLEGEAHTGSVSTPAQQDLPATGSSTAMPAQQGPAEEFVTAVLKAAELEAMTADAGKADVALQEANNEIEMLAFLLDDVMLDRAIRLLQGAISRREEDLVLQRPDRGASAVVVRRLQAQLAELRQHVKAHVAT